MRLQDLEQFDPITIQCHDNPDADALGAGCALYYYFKQKGKNGIAEYLVDEYLTNRELMNSDNIINQISLLVDNDFVVINNGILINISIPLLKFSNILSLLLEDKISNA